MAHTKNTKRSEPTARYPLAEFKKLSNNQQSNLPQTNNEFIQCLLHELINRVLSLIKNDTHDKSVDDTNNQNMEFIDVGTDKENCITTSVHGNDKLTKHLKLIQENRKTSFEQPKIYSEMVASTGHPNKIKGGKPSAFYESYYAKTNKNNLRSTKRGKGIGRKKIKINSSYSQVKGRVSGSGKHFETKPPTPKKHYTSEGKTASATSIRVQYEIQRAKQSTGAIKKPHKY